MIVIATGFIPLSPLSVCFDNGYVGKQPVAWREYCAEYWLTAIQESMDRCTGRRVITEILLKNGVKRHKINFAKMYSTRSIKSGLHLSCRVQFLSILRNLKRCRLVES